MEPRYSTRDYGHAKVTFPLTHVFCGEINRGEAHGFHSRPGGKDPPWSNIAPNKSALALKRIKDHEWNYGFPAFKKVGVFNANTSNWIRRNTSADHDENGYYGFFPNQWTVSDVVNKVSKCTYECCQSPGVDCIKEKSQTLCLTRFNETTINKPFDVTVFLRPSIKMHIIMTTAFPVRRTKIKCKGDAWCNVQELKCF